MHLRNINGMKSLRNPTQQQCPTAFRRYWDMDDAERAHVCGDASGPMIEGVGTVCTLHKGHAGSHYDGVAGIEWTVDFCGSCRGKGRVVWAPGVDHPAVRIPRDVTCPRCCGLGRVSRAGRAA